MSEINYLDYEGLHRYHELIDAKKADKSELSDKTAIKLDTVSGTNKTDSTIISANSSNGLSILGGTNLFKIGDGTNYIEVPITPSISNNITGSGTNGYLTRFNGTNTITNGPALSSAISSLTTSTKFLREDGTWAAPSYIANTNTTYKFTIGTTTKGDSTNGVDLGTLKSETATPNGTTLSLVTTGEKATWNAKQNALTNPVTRSGSTALTADKIVLGAGTTLVQPSSYGITTTTPSSSSDNTTIPTSSAVWSAISNGIAANDAMVYSGTIEGGSTGSYGALTGAASKGNTYKVTKAGKINGVAVEIGDMIICNTDDTSAATSSNYTTIAANWDYILANIDGAVTGPSSSTNNRIVVFNGTTGKVIKDSGYTIATSVPSGAVFTDLSVTSSANHYTPAIGETANVTASGSSTLTRNSSLVVTAVTTDSKGHVVGLTTGKLPASDNTDTKVTSAENHYKATGVAEGTKSASGATGKAGTTVQVITGITTDAAGHVTGITSGAATDTDTKVTSSANHYTPATASGSDVTASASGATAAWSIDVVKGITVNTDGKGHITGLSVTSGKIPANPNTDTKVTDANGTGKAFLLGHTTQGTNATAITNTNVYMSSGKLYSNNKEVALVENIPVLGSISYGTGATLDSSKLIDALFITD